jgi:hypothetical protein
MSAALPDLTPEIVLRGYFHAKDENRPHRLERVFDPGAKSVIVNHADTIAFPARTVGREAITDVLVRKFAQTYENIYSFYLRRPTVEVKEFSCGWLVAMSEKHSKSARVGCGRYDWAFSEVAPHLATHLSITIHAMQVLPPNELATILAWVKALSYPWCTAEEAVRIAPRSELLAPVLQHLSAHASGV